MLNKIMVNKYNIALLPCTQASLVIQWSHQLSGLADVYLLGEHSLPHVTLYQFSVQENELESCWNKVVNNLSMQKMWLHFKKWNVVSYDQHYFWVSLLPDENSQLLECHHQVAQSLRLPIKEKFDPHMTLIRTTVTDCEKRARQMLSSFQSLEDEFVLALGKSDAVGQFTDIIYSCKGSAC